MSETSHRGTQRGTRTFGGRLVAVGIVLALAACGGGDDDAADDGDDAAAATDPPATDPPATDPPATDPPTTDPPATDPPATDPPATDPPATDPPATDPPAGPEGVMPENNSGWRLQPGPADDITAGPITVYWYRGANDGNYVAVYQGEGIADATGLGLCPGNSIATDQFLHVSNTPSEAGACDGFPTEPSSLQVCDKGVWIYETKIPGDLQGVLYGSLEWNDGGGIAGLYNQAETLPDMPELQPGLASYQVPPWFTTDGSSVIDCGAPITG